MTNPAANDIAISANDLGTLFVSRLASATDLGETIADSATFRRVRGFNNKTTGQWVEAKTFTPRKIRTHGAAMVAAYLSATGTDLAEGTRVWLLVDGCTLLGEVSAAS